MVTRKEGQAMKRDHGEDQSGWLIEREGHQWFTGRTWTPDSTKAARFSSREDAEWTIKAIAFSPADNIKATEHSWS